MYVRVRVCEWVTMCRGYCSYAACAKKTNSNSRQYSPFDGLPAPMPCKPLAAPPPPLHLALLSYAYTFNNNEELGAKSIAFSAGPLPKQSSRHSRAPLSFSLCLSSPHSPSQSLSMNCILVIQLAIEAIAHTRTHLAIDCRDCL